MNVCPPSTSFMFESAGTMETCAPLSPATEESDVSFPPSSGPLDVSDEESHVGSPN